MLICFQIKRSVFLRGFHSARKLLGDDVHVCLLFFFVCLFCFVKTSCGIYMFFPEIWGSGLQLGSGEGEAGLSVK